MQKRAVSLVLLLALSGCGVHPGASPKVAGAARADALEAQAAHEVLVKLKPGRQSLTRATRVLPRLGWQVVTLPGDVEAGMAGLRRDPAIAAVEPQHLAHLFDQPRAGLATPRFALAFNDPDLPKRQKTDERIQLARAWQVTTGSPDVVVAILDTGVDEAHPELQGKLVPGYDVVNDNPNPHDDHSHGTSCSGIVAALADNGQGVAGMAPGCRVMPVKVLNKRGVGPLEWAAKGIVWAVDHGARVVSMSFGEDAPSQVLQDAIDYARAHNVLCIASMGNDGEEVKHWPACSDGVLALGATYEDDRPALFTTEGSWVCMAAPGSRVYTISPTYEIIDPMFGKRDLNYTYFSGTSASSPVAAAVAALVISHEPAITEPQLKQRLRKTSDDVGDPGWDRQTGDGRVNAFRALTEMPSAR